MGRVSSEAITKLNNFLDSLPEEARNKCAICNKTLVHIVKQAEVKTGLGTATVTRVLAEKINETSIENDKTTATALKGKINWVDTESIRRQSSNKPVKPESDYDETTKELEELEDTYNRIIVEEAKKLNARKAKEKLEKKMQAYQERVETIKETKNITPPNFVIADPPWQYDFSETDGRKIENHYNTETTIDMENHIPKTQEDCILMMWATAPKLKEAFELMLLWGFEFKTCAVWDKEKIGMGYWFRGQHELLLVGTKGNVSPPLPTFRVSSVFREERTEHSKKPECVYKWIEEAFADKIKLEMYCRTPRENWQVWGNEV